MHRLKWNAQQPARSKILFQLFPNLKEAYSLYLNLVDIFNKRTVTGVAKLKLAKWYNDVEEFRYEGFSKVVQMFENHNDIIVNYFKTGLPMHRQSRLVLKSRLSRHSSEEPGI